MKKLSPPVRILIGMVAGVLLGVVMVWMPAGWFRDDFLQNGVLRVGGELFLNAFKLMVVPVVFFSLVDGINAMEDPRSLGRVGIKTLWLYLLTTVVAISLGLGVAFVFSPGSGMERAVPDAGVAANAVVSTPAGSPSFADVLIGIIPQNLLQPLGGAAMLQVLFLAICVGLALAMLGDKAAHTRALFSELSSLCIKLIEMIMFFAPFGIFCLLARTFAEFGLEALLPLFKYLCCIALGMILQLALVDAALLRFWGRLRAWVFYRKFAPVMLLAFSTSSSNAALPLNIETLRKDMGVSERIATLVISLGATINMNGTAIMQGIAAVFIAQFYHVDLSVAQVLSIVVTATLASVGTAGVPGAGIIMLAMVLQSANLPMEGVALIMGVDRLVDMMRTVVNVTGDAVCACLVGASERELDRDCYNRR